MATSLHHRLSAHSIGSGSNLQCGYKVFLAVGAHLTHRELRTGDNHRFAQIFEHEAQRRGGVGHSIRAVEHHKTVEIGIMPSDVGGYLLPV